MILVSASTFPSTLPAFFISLDTTPPKKGNFAGCQKKWFIKKPSMTEVPGIQHSPQSWGFWELQCDSAWSKGEGHGLFFRLQYKNRIGSRETWILFLALSLPWCQAAGKSLTLSGLSFPSTKWGQYSITSEKHKTIGVFWVLANETTDNINYVTLGKIPCSPLRLGFPISKLKKLN